MTGAPPRFRLSSSISMPAFIALGLRCMYRIVVLRSECRAISWMVRAGTPAIARCEQNVWRYTCSRPVFGSPAFASAR